MSISKTNLSQHNSPPSSVLDWLGITSARAIAFYFVLATVLGSGLLVVRTTHENRTAFSELQDLRDQAVQLDVQWGQLLLEQSTFGVDGRIEDKAIQQLNMQVPQIDDIVMVGHD